MANNISKITPLDGETRNLKDAQAREDLAALTEKVGLLEKMCSSGHFFGALLDSDGNPVMLTGGSTAILAEWRI